MPALAGRQIRVKQRSQAAHERAGMPRHDEAPPLLQHQPVIGHAGEGLPYWLSRIDFMHGASVRSGRYASQPKLKRNASDYLKHNFYYTTSGMAWESVR